MSDLIDREAVMEIILMPQNVSITEQLEMLKKLPSAKPKDWMEQNKDRILQAGKEGREVEFRIDGRLFAIREKAQ